MSSLLFKQCDGIVSRLSTKCKDDSVLFRIKLDGRQIWLPVTGFALEMGGNYQFLHTVSDFIYFYAFGDRIGELNVTGMAFIKRSCRQVDFNVDVPVWNGGLWSDQASNWSTNSFGLGLGSNDDIQNLYDLYERFQISRKPRAIEVGFGNVQAFYGFLTGMRVEVARPDIPVAQYVLRIHVIPKN
jgi:hypothetical protein